MNRNFDEELVWEDLGCAFNVLMDPEFDHDLHRLTRELEMPWLSEF